MTGWSRFILIVALIFLGWLFYWLAFAPKPDISQRIYQTLKAQTKQADLAFTGVAFQEIDNGVKYWELKAKTASVNKSTGLATLQEAKGTFYKHGRPVLRFVSPAALWDMKKKEILLDQPLGYDVKLERRLSALLNTIERQNFSIFSLPKLSNKESGYWFQANNLSWRLEDQKILCTGGIMLNKGEVTGYGEKLESDVGLDKVRLEGHPLIIIQPESTYPISLEAEIIEVNSTDDSITARGQPVITWQAARITAISAKYLQASQRLELAGNVTINYKAIQAWGKTARYLVPANEVVLAGNARALQGDNQLTGDQVAVSFNDQKISVVGQGKVTITEEEMNQP
jgi:lipopolysaccharide export system protein LptA